MFIPTIPKSETERRQAEQRRREDSKILLREQTNATFGNLVQLFEINYPWYSCEYEIQITLRESAKVIAMELPRMEKEDRLAYCARVNHYYLDQANCEHKHIGLEHYGPDPDGMEEIVCLDCHQTNEQPPHEIPF